MKAVSAALRFDLSRARHGMDSPVFVYYSLRTTSHLCVKRERPLIMTFSLYSENIIALSFLPRTRQRRIKIRGAQAKKLASSQLFMRKTNTFLDVY